MANLDIKKKIFIFAPTKNIKHGMNNDLSERISQDFYREKIESDRRNAEVADWLFRSCQTDSSEFDRAELLKSSHGLISRESIVAEDYAMAHNIWFKDASLLGMPGACGDENYCYLSPDGLTIYKVNVLSHSSDRILPIFNKILIHNELFPETRYDFVGFTNMGFARSAYPIFKQIMVKDADNAKPEEIADFMTALSFCPAPEKNKPAAWKNDNYLVWDLQPKNVLMDKDHNLYVIDAEIEIL